MNTLPEHWSKSDTARLLAETNRNRIEFFRAELKLATSCASIAEKCCDMEHRERAQRYIELAEKAYWTLVRFLSDPKHATHIGEQQRQELTTGMRQLRESLDWLQG